MLQRLKKKAITLENTSKCEGNQQKNSHKRSRKGSNSNTEQISLVNSPLGHQTYNKDHVSYEARILKTDTKSYSKKKTLYNPQTSEDSIIEEKAENNLFQALNYMVENLAPRLLDKRDENELETISDFCIVKDTTKKIKTFQSSLDSLMSFFKRTYDDATIMLNREDLQNDNKVVNSIPIEDFKWPKSPVIRNSKPSGRQKHICSHQDCQKEYSTKAALLLHMKSKHVSEQSLAIKKRKQKHRENLNFESLSNLKIKLENLDPLEDTKQNQNLAMELSETKEYLENDIDETIIMNENLDDQNSLKKSKCSTADATKDHSSRDQDNRLLNVFISENLNDKTENQDLNLKNSEALNRFFEVNTGTNNQYEENEQPGGLLWDNDENYYNDKKDSLLYGLEDDLEAQVLETDVFNFCQSSMNLNNRTKSHEYCNHPKIQSDNVNALNVSDFLTSFCTSCEPKRKTSFLSLIDEL